MRWRRWAVGLGLVAVLGACTEDAVGEDGPDDTFLSDDDGKADAFGIADGSVEACSVLRLVNQADADELRGIVNPAAANITAHRAGPDQRLFTADDRVIGSLIELDAIRYVGPVSLGKLLSYALASAYACEPSEATGDECTILRAANESSLTALDDDAGLDRRAADGIVARQPLATLQALDDVPYVGSAAISRLLTYGKGAGLACTAPPVGCAGGTIEGVAFTKDEECRTVDYMNRARLSLMASLTETVRHYVYDCHLVGGRIDCTMGRRAMWRSVRELGPWLSTTSTRALRDAAAAWRDDGVTDDTIAATYLKRTGMVNLPVGFAQVRIMRAITSPAGQYCYEVRDAGSQSTWLPACVTADGAAACASERCLGAWVGKDVAFRGTLLRDTTQTSGVRIAVAHQAPTPPVAR